MPNASHLQQRVFRISGEREFNDTALEIFHLQYENNPVYRKFIQQLRPGFGQPDSYSEIPFLPVEFFKTHTVRTGNFEPEIIFTSSGTAGSNTSRHLIRSARLYESSFLKTFEMFYGDVTDKVVLALLPSYLERQGSSLVHMAERLISGSRQKESGFYLNEYDKLGDLLQRLSGQDRSVLLLGVTFALLDLAELYPVDFPSLIIMETGGMKGRRHEMTREEVHEKLKTAFRVNHVHSEYGMTELLSQAYSRGGGLFQCPPWMKVLIRDMNDPFHLLPPAKTGGISVIDLANIHSCAFLATQDLGRSHPDGTFEVLGRFDHSDLRGCNLLVV